ncbi:MAG: succinylglutamate desuccinylase/aspartoacylase family protein [Planctomycetaceae bacterium]
MTSSFSVYESDSAPQLESRTDVAAKIEINGSSTGPHLLIIGGVHGDEFEPMVCLHELIRFLNSRQQQIQGKITIIPIVNEAAFEHENRVAPDGKDLARTCPRECNGNDHRTDSSLTEH